jgi:hypothetical protein
MEKKWLGDKTAAESDSVPTGQRSTEPSLELDLLEHLRVTVVRCEL